MSSVMSGLAAALGGGGGAPDPTGGMGAPPPDTGQDMGASDTGDQGSQYATSLDALDGAEEALQSYVQLEPDAGDRAAGSKLLQGVLQLKAKDQQDKQQGNMAGLQRALQANGAGGGGPTGG